MWLGQVGARYELAVGWLSKQANKRESKSIRSAAGQPSGLAGQWDADLSIQGGLLAGQCDLLALPQLHQPEARHDTRMIVRQGRSETG